MEECLLSNNSSDQAGWLTPLNAEPEYDEALDQLLSDWVRQLAEYPEGRVFPRWQKEALPPFQAETDGCICGVVDVPVDDNPALAVQTEEGCQLSRHEVFKCLTSFYGPAGMRYAARFRDGLCIEQNNTALNQLGLTVMDYSKLTPFPELINNQWVHRYDMTVCLRRNLVREYGIKSLVDASVQFFGE